MNILLVTEEITERPSEGLLVFVMHLCRFLGSRGDLTVVHASGEPDPSIDSYRALRPRTILTRPLVRIARNRSFDTAVYIPSSGLTSLGMLRSQLLRFLFGCPLIIIALQERRVGWIHRLVAGLGRVELVLSPVLSLRRELERLGLVTDFIMPGFDDRLFRPVSPEERMIIRRKYSLPLDRFIVLHVGHIKENRNMQVFLRYRDWGADVQPVIKGGEVDPSWRQRLRLAGIIVIDEYIDNMHELYQLADCYLFPVSSPMGALEFPLSVVEAAACNLPVLTTRFGVLPDVIPEGGGLAYYGHAGEIPARLAELRDSPSATAPKVCNFSWESVFEKYIMPQIRSLAVGKKGA